MNRRGVRLLLYLIALPGSLVATWACGAATGVGLLDEVAGGEGGGRDGTIGCGSSGELCCDGGDCGDASDASDAADAPRDTREVEASDGPVGPPGDAGPRSCRAGGPGMTNCGASHESCCTSLEVTGGTFHRTYTNEGMGPIDEADPATVSTFRLDKYLVTVGRFRQFVSAWYAGSATPPAGSGKHEYLNGGSGLENSQSPGTYEPGWVAADDSNVAPTEGNLTISHPYATWTRSAGSQETLPMDCVNWWEAYAFCIWDGGFLPSEAEWEYAAAGGNDEREYPWGTTYPSYDNQYAIYDCYYPSTNPKCSGVENIAPVGTPTLGAGRWGQLDLAGDLLEWNLDWYATFTHPCTDCAAVNSPPDRALRGGTFSYGATTALLASVRANDPPTARGFVGLRCARAP